ncbi:MAG: helix-turn-helix domain-containing protein [Bermanella sp.]|mgnify:CR=1 FL=1
MGDKLLNITETCTILNVSEVTVKRWAREHLLRSVKNGSEIMFPEPDVMKYKEINDKLSK